MDSPRRGPRFQADTSLVDRPYARPYSYGMATRLVPKTDLRDRIRDELAELGEDTIVVTERGRPLAVAISVERWNALQETMENLEDALAVAEARLAGDRGRPAKDILEAIDDDVRGPTRATG